MSAAQQPPDLVRLDEHGNRWVRERQDDHLCTPVTLAQIDALSALALAAGEYGEASRLSLYRYALVKNITWVAYPVPTLIRPVAVHDDGPCAYRLDEKGRVLVFRWPAPGLIAEPLSAADFSALAERYENAASWCDEQGRQVDAFTRCVRADYLRSVAARLSPEHYSAAVPTYSPSTAGAA